MNLSIKFPIVLLVLMVMSDLTWSTEEVVLGHAIELTPANISTTSVCLEITDSGAPEVAVSISVPPILGKARLRSFLVIIHRARGESTTMESMPITVNGLSTIYISEVRDDGKLDDLEIQVIYQRKNAIPYLQIIRLDDYSNLYGGVSGYNPVTQINCVHKEKTGEK